jgi:hypothetical protein
MEKPYLSISQINMYFRCGAQYEFRYILGKKAPPGFFMIVGSAVDDTVNENLGSKMGGNGLLPIEEIVDLAADSFDGRWKKAEENAENNIAGDAVVLTDDEKEIGFKKAKGQAKDKSIRLAQLHASEFAPIIQPTHLQRKVKVTLPNHPYDLLGYLDIQEGNRSIRDTKTSGKTPAADIADRDDQLTMYAMMVYKNDGEIPSFLSLDYLIDLKTPKAKSFGTKRTIEDCNVLLMRVETVSRGLEKGIFIPARETDWCCSPRWCGYFGICEFVKRSRRMNG